MGHPFEFCNLRFVICNFRTGIFCLAWVVRLLMGVGGRWLFNGILVVELVPGFAVFFETGWASSAIASGIDADRVRSVDLGDGNDVPDVERGDVGDDEIDLVERIVRGALIVDEVDGVSP